MLMHDRILVSNIQYLTGWGPAPEVQVTANDDDAEDKEERLVKIIDVSDNEGEEQDPPPPKRPRVMHESSDNRNLGT